jgi:hypothetical protein
VKLQAEMSSASALCPPEQAAIAWLDSKFGSAPACGSSASGSCGTSGSAKGADFSLMSGSQLKLPCIVPFLLLLFSCLFLLLSFFDVCQLTNPMQIKVREAVDRKQVWFSSGFHHVHAASMFRCTAAVRETGCRQLPGYQPLPSCLQPHQL